MKFQNIKTGDIVFAKSSVRVGWGGREQFWTPQKVEKVTPKQFVVGGERYKKEDGSCIGRYNSVANLGDVIHRDKVKDQTEEKNDLILKVSQACDANEIIYGFKVKYDHPNLASILTHLKQAQIALESI